MPPEQAGPEGPPEDPDDWTDEQWLSWLASTDGPDGGEGSAAHTRRRPTGRAAGALGNAMVGVYNALYGRPDDEVVVVADAPGDPPGDDHPLVRLDPEHPERSEVVVRSRRGRQPGRTRR